MLMHLHRMAPVLTLEHLWAESPIESQMQPSSLTERRTMSHQTRTRLPCMAASSASAVTYGKVNPSQLRKVQGSSCDTTALMAMRYIIAHGLSSYCSGQAAASVHYSQARPLRNAMRLLLIYIIVVSWVYAAWRLALAYQYILLAAFQGLHVTCCNSCTALVGVQPT